MSTNVVTTSTPLYTSLDKLITYRFDTVISKGIWIYRQCINVIYLGMFRLTNIGFSTIFATRISRI